MVHAAFSPMEALTRDSIRIDQVEDNPNDIMLTDACLKQAGFSQRIHHFDSCGKAQDNLSRIECAPDVILLDLNMPGMGGLAMLEWLRKKYQVPQIPIFVLTASDSPADRQKAMDAGVTKYILKTGLLEELIRELDHLIAEVNQKRQEQEKKRQETFAGLVLKYKNSSEMIMLIDASGRIHWVNESFERMSGYTLDELKGKKPGRKLQGPQSDPEAIQMFRDAFQSAKPCEGRVINYKKDGTGYQVLISLRPVLTDDRLIGFLAIEKVLKEQEDPMAKGMTSKVIGSAKI
jgi:PAS domain S-box-containing protein